MAHRYREQDLNQFDTDEQVPNKKIKNKKAKIKKLKKEKDNA